MLVGRVKLERIRVLQWSCQDGIKTEQWNQEHLVREPSQFY